MDEKKMHRIENYHLYCNDRPYELAYKRLMRHNKKASSLLYFYFVLFLYDFVVFRVALRRETFEDYV